MYQNTIKYTKKAYYGVRTKLYLELKTKYKSALKYRDSETRRMGFLCDALGLPVRYTVRSLASAWATVG